MSNHVLVIAEAASSWRFGSDHLSNALRSIEAAKECGADCWKAQWTSDPLLMAQRRHGKREEFEILAYPFEWLEKLKAKCDEVQIEFMVTCFIEKDIALIAPLVKRFKVASAESGDMAFLTAHTAFMKDIIVSHGFGSIGGLVTVADGIPHGGIFDIWPLHCVVSYPTPVDQLNLARLKMRAANQEHAPNYFSFTGLSDHSTSVLSGAVAVGAGATIIEKHVRLNDTPKENPDYGHSLIVNVYEDESEVTHGIPEFAEYVHNIREAESMMGTGKDAMQECERPNMGRRVVGG